MNYHQVIHREAGKSPPAQRFLRGPVGQLDAGAGTSADGDVAVGVPDGVSLGAGVPAGVAGWLGVGPVSLGEGLADRDGLAVRDGVGDSVGVGARVGAEGGVTTGVDGAGLALPAGCTEPAGGTELAGSGRTSTYSTSTPRNAPMSTMVEVRGRLLMRRPRSPGRYRARPTR
jgi:hypothetical protein